MHRPQHLSTHKASKPNLTTHHQPHHTCNLSPSTTHELHHPPPISPHVKFLITNVSPHFTIDHPRPYTTHTSHMHTNPHHLPHLTTISLSATQFSCDGGLLSYEHFHGDLFIQSFTREIFPSGPFT